MKKNTQNPENTMNPGSAIGEAIGAQMEIALNEYLAPLVDQYSCHLISKGKRNPKTNKETKLLLYDDFGTAYNIDGVVVNEMLQPIILIEYKYIRYKKHNRDKGSWLCTAHNAVRLRYNSVRSSMAILAGSWSKTSITMMKSHDINLFIIPFEVITDLLKEYDIKFDWGEKDRHIAKDSWEKYQQLSNENRSKIAHDMISVVKEEIETAIKRTLDNTTIRETDKVVIEIHTNIGEVKRFTFKTVEDALDFLEDFSFEELLDNNSSIAIFDGPPKNEEEYNDDE